eukprot:CAMPEP_0195308338 /NCGR_PEP_ID=MMETSP0707-20130614/38175_1 /TAXON_ID=33640 /ORGANISM="Asterionellopsis glacialis, Strain CCMP134" /LENGTH=458 /DNA_ID=CAMNT_0040372605 /DNA_START=4 /DNA_END=1380 /DNA_ORIENTATION=-
MSITPSPHLKNATNAAKPKGGKVIAPFVSLVISMVLLLSCRMLQPVEAASAKLVRLDKKATLVCEDTSPLLSGGFFKGKTSTNSGGPSCVYSTFVEACSVDRRILLETQTPGPTPVPGSSTQTPGPTPGPGSPSTPSTPPGDNNNNNNNNNAPIDNEKCLDNDIDGGFTVTSTSGNNILIGTADEGMMPFVKTCNRQRSTSVCVDFDFAPSYSGTTQTHMLEDSIGNYVAYDVVDEGQLLGCTDICLHEDGSLGGADAQNLDKCRYSDDFPDWFLLHSNFEDKCVQSKPCQELEVIQACESYKDHYDFTGIYLPVDSSECKDDKTDKSRTLYKSECNSSSGDCKFLYYDMESGRWYMSIAQDNSGSCFRWGDSPSTGIFSDWDVVTRFTKEGASEPYLDLVGSARCYKGQGADQDYTDKDPFEIRCNKLDSSRAAGRWMHQHATILLSGVLACMTLLY